MACTFYKMTIKRPDHRKKFRKITPIRGQFIFETFTLLCPLLWLPF